MTTIWSFWPAFASMSASELFYGFGSHREVFDTSTYLSGNQGTASQEGKFSSYNLNSTDFQLSRKDKGILGHS